MNYYIVPIRQNFPLESWSPDVTTVVYEARCYNIPTNCRVMTEDTCDNGTVITKEEYDGACDE